MPILVSNYYCCIVCCTMRTTVHYSQHNSVKLHMYNTVGRNMNFSPGPYVIKILSGQISGKFDILVMDDNIRPSFNLTIQSSSLPSYVTVGDPSQATVITKDDDDGMAIHYVHTTVYVIKSLNTSSQ